MVTGAKATINAGLAAILLGVIAWAAALGPVLAADEGWPRTIQTLKGPLKLERAPQRIVSTSVTLTGTLLAINAPVIASGATHPNSRIADGQGFLTQWGDIARQRQVSVLYQSLPNAEAVAANAPDLIIIAATGGDSALALYDQLSVIAPTLLINYDDKSWQQLAVQLGEATGHELDAANTISAFEQRVSKVKASMTLPPQPVSAFVYQEDGKGANLWTSASAQGRLLEELGFSLAPVPESVRGNHSMGQRKDIVQIGGENMASGLAGNTWLLFSADQSSVEALKKNRFLAQQPAVRRQHVYAMGKDTFRLDYYSAGNLLDRLEAQFVRQSH
ncbi:iron complex transport system substrate-binding protein [Biostraticola tofi]|uniref:Ferric enterobactin-binding periplasmic protein FepB n=1 Tax=Biostraticola tofi TaxID=466109 RepID=A0A4R3Z7G4_9GAMM|nr:iron complex transport system substrate-binding protein [Biostraticola tofi]